MKSAVKIILLVVFVLGLNGCCCKLKKQVDQLTLDKQDLEGQLQQSQSKLDEQQATLANCQDKLAMMQGKESSLQRELDKARKLAGKLPSGWTVKKGMAMTSLADSVLFDSGKAKLKRSAAGKLDKVIRQINAKFRGKDVYIMGHTDSDPIKKSKWKDNLELSLHRSAAVARYMTTHGLNPRQVIVAGVGKYRPVASNKSRSGKAKNRRVEFWILKPM